VFQIFDPVVTRITIHRKRLIRYDEMPDVEFSEGTAKSESLIALRLSQLAAQTWVFDPYNLVQPVASAVSKCVNDGTILNQWRPVDSDSRFGRRAENF
jgi:hypothetical protein